MMIAAACTTESGIDLETFGHGETGDADDGDGPGEAGDESGDEAGGDEDDGGDGDGACDTLPTPPELLDDQEDFYCPAGTTYDGAYQLCVGADLAVGPMTGPMVDACRACGLGATCDEADWPEDLARSLRGADPCWPGTQPTEDPARYPYCVDADYAWGPFPPDMVARCQGAGGGNSCESMRWTRSFAEQLVPPARTWSWIMPLDVGIRDDGAGGGHFGASRFNNSGGHSGIDILAPVGTPLLSACDGTVSLAAPVSGYGNTVIVVCRVPESVTDGAEIWVSMLYAHLDTLGTSTGASVAAGDVVGTVGKSGNASGSSVNPHVHYEMALHSSEGAAFGESHASSNHAGNAAGDAFAAAIETACWGPAGFDSTSGPKMKGRRPDPFMALACLIDKKPTLEAPSSALQTAFVPWSDHYQGNFDVDAGVAP